MQEILYLLNQQLWGNGLVILLLGTGLFCLVSGKFAPFRSWKKFSRNHQSPNSAKHTPFQACMTSLGAEMGTGNIIGVATALTLGGAGAIFWMWVSAFVGMGLIYAENVLSCIWKDDEYSGAVAYIRHGLKSPVLSGIFAVCCVGASFGMGNMTQSHAMAQTLQASFRVSPYISGILTAILTGIIIFGGAERIGKFSGMIVPVLSGVYLVTAFIVMFRFRENLGAVFLQIFREAIGKSAVTGGISGYAVKNAVSVGVRRGIFSNEAGLGSSGILHSETNESPEFMGVCGMLEVIADTFLCCTVTALTILCTGVTGADGGELVLMAFRAGIGNLADWILPPIIALFALCTLVGWSFCGACAFRSITNGKYVRIYQSAFCIAVFLGAVAEMQTIWTMADIANACMAYCNIPAILLLYPSTIPKRKKFVNGE